jgi:hypothetical protein
MGLTFALAPFTQLLLEKYAWQGTDTQTDTHTMSVGVWEVFHDSSFYDVKIMYISLSVTRLLYAYFRLTL